MKNNMNDLINFINKYQSFSIVSHISPDGDTLGSALAFSLCLESLGKKVEMICNDDINQDNYFLPNIDKYKKYDQWNTQAVIFCDCATLNLTGFKSVDLPSLNVDHHISNEEYGDVNYIIPNASATCEVMYDIVCALGAEITIDIAKCIYLGICTDTNNFTNSNVTSNTFSVMSKISKLDFGMKDIVKFVYRTRSLEKTKAIAKIINNMTLHFDGKFGISYLKYDDASKLNGTEGLIDYITDIKGVSVSCFIKESNKNEFKISMRSNYNVDVQKICSAFRGGGHIKAAGCKVTGNLEEIINKIMDEAKKWME